LHCSKGRLAKSRLSKEVYRFYIGLYRLKTRVIPWKKQSKKGSILRGLVAAGQDVRVVSLEFPTLKNSSAISSSDGE
jgi:hypothetical protein